MVNGWEPTQKLIVALFLLNIECRLSEQNALFLDQNVIYKSMLLKSKLAVVAILSSVLIGIIAGT